MAGLMLRGVRKQFGDVSVIRDVDLDIEPGEFCVFVGPSGCGKSTLLRMIAGLEEISAGTIAIGDRVVNAVDPAERGVAMVFQSYALYPHMTVEENMGFGLRMTGVAKDVIRERVRVAAGILQLEPFLKRKPKALSGGQRQRVAIGRAIVRDPQVFLFDEPLSNLDAELRVAMRLEIARLHQELDASTMVYVTHDQTEAMTLADKIVVLRLGRVEQVGAPLALYDDPANRFVAGFIGSPRMNFLAATVAQKHDGAVTVALAAHDGTRITLPVAGAGLETGAPCALGIRPEHVDAEGEGGGECARLTVRIDVVEHLGGASYLYGTAPGGETLVVETRTGRDIRPGSPLTLTIPPTRSFLFDDAEQRVR